MNSQETKKLENKILAILQKILPKKETLILGISGGPDSVFLAEILAKTDHKIILAHLNHQLRKEADHDEKFVKKLAEKFAMKFESKKSDVAKLGKKYKMGIEEMGRELRYEFFEKLCKKYKARFLLTAHHADDNLETILLNFSRGASLRGLLGMQTVEDFHNNRSAKEIHLLRPLLDITKTEISDYLQSKKIQFLIDDSNYDTQYKRNLIRHEVIPKLKEINSSLAQTVASNSRNLREIQDFLRETATNFISKFATKPSTKPTTNSTPKPTSKITKIPLKEFQKLHPVIRKEVLLEIYKTLVGETRNLRSIHLEEVLQLTKKNIGNKKKKFGKLEVTLYHGSLTLRHGYQA